MHTLKNCKILFADDDIEYNNSFSKTLSYFCDKVIVAYDGEEAYNLFLSNDCQIVIIDLQMPKLDGMNLAKKIREINEEVPIFIVTNYQDFESARMGYKYNLVDFLVKPVTFEVLLQTLEKCEKLINKLREEIIKLDNNCFYNKSTKTISVNEEVSKITNAEAIVLEHLIFKRGILVRTEEFESLFFDKQQSITSLKNIVYKLRQKLPKDLIKNFSKMGYLLK